MADDIKDDVTEDQVQADQAQAEDDLPEIEDAPGDDEEWTEEDMRLLSDEERAALFGDDEGEGDADEADEGDAEDEPAAQAASDDAAQDDTDSMVGTQAPDLAALDAEIEALDAAKVAAFDDWEEGNLSRDEYLAKLAEIDGVSKQTIAQRAVAESQEQAVYNAFIGTAKGYFGEFPDLATQSHAEAYDRHVRSVTGNPAYQHMTHRQMLEAAHTLYAAEAEVLGVDVPAPKGKAKPSPTPALEAKADPAPAPARKPRPGDKAPVTLRNVPNAAPVSASDGKYSSLAQRLENAGPEEYERIMGSMSPDEAEAFASMDV
ncbi:hypothetical protein [Yoonia sp.]|uniref:hypothetical protein n=1 Tax=Yoonia sp. TaxID=2212373 RepID=UPI002DF86AE5|nr:hypothetical protein [Yoonia sp.]